ncbi:MAG: DUF1801 domain-containing protein [Proteobacteria bacterium]|nr:DUF1801 domain-containing protein [Pseudomonadota bacterium]
MKKEIKDYLAAIEGETKKKDSLSLVSMMEEETGFKAALHGKIVGFGLYDYKYESGREGTAIATGFSPRKQSITVYIMPGFSRYEKELAKLGKHKTTKSCLYINKLSDVDEKVLRKIVRLSIVDMSKKYALHGPRVPAVKAR